MAKEYPASKAQMVKAAELEIDTTDRPGYTTLGARLEDAGWSKDGKTPMTETSVPLASIALEMKAGHKSDYERRQEHKARGPWWQQSRPESDTDDEGRPVFAPDTRPSSTVPLDEIEG